MTESSPTDTGKNKGGRPTLLTPERMEKIGRIIKKGLSYEDASLAGNITYNTFNNWMKRGKEDTEGPYFEFFQYIKGCELEGKEENLDNISEAGRNGQWQASAWLLERRYPLEYGRKDRISADIRSENVNVNTELPDENRSAILSRLFTQSTPE